MSHLRLSLTAALFGALLHASCGYSVGLIAPAGFDTVAVEVFHNDTLEPDLERALHSALSVEVRDRVPLPLVSPGDSKLLIRGRLVDFGRVRGIRNPQNQVLESGVRVVVEAWTVRSSTGEVVHPKTTARATIGYPVGSSSGERAARARAIRQLAQALTVDLFSRAVSDEEAL
ncbi:MAG: LPS assembly lipoprotein LptE [Planctomycetes bacterium]|nr:LPS assembly lipoprotein LptE [Planctomycetota bacterium]